MPATIDMRLFWLSLVAYLILPYVGSRLTRRTGIRSGAHRRAVISFIVIALLCGTIQLYPLSRWVPTDSTFHQLFAWFGVHGWVGLLFVRMSRMMRSWLMQKAPREATSSI